MADPCFARIPGGWFLMGSEEGHDDERPVHRVWVDAFDLAVYPVTRAQYAAFLDATGHASPREWVAGPSDPDLPIVGVSWLDAQAYCGWRSAAGDPMRLPTEAEWERAARGGVDGARYAWGDAIPAWIPGGGRGPLAGPWPVTLGEPTAFGLFGISANVHEWCQDWYGASCYAASAERNPSGPAAGVRRASRGGSWRHAVTLTTCAARSRLDPSFRYTDYGFRVARDVEPHAGGAVTGRGAGSGRADASNGTPATSRREYTGGMTGPTVARPGRNEPCHCGSSRKYKHCCLEKDDAEAAAALATAQAAEATQEPAAAPAAPPRAPRHQTDQPWKAATSRGFIPKSRTPRKVGGS